ncbi:hypothetical protein XSR1_180038 [Xenorhabdus szentirmaii DSM 16338]|uniref:Uncharacterized protein n=1 Tax=Xenorhabdus szentirmaii DSM 16338 TaxID=1427518 RepID=W1IU87_9GAMM|nr:hypothetical protein XSR1_180038 [Xenorhabdus szentirmaii DSM 16338]
MARLKLFVICLIGQKRSNGVRRNAQSNNLWAVSCSLLDCGKSVLIYYRVSNKECCI